MSAERRTCRCCGKPLPAFQWRDKEWNTAGRAGYMGDDTFCTLRCGYSFGLAYARASAPIRAAAAPELAP